MKTFSAITVCLLLMVVALCAACKDNRAPKLPPAVAIKPIQPTAADIIVELQSRLDAAKSQVASESNARKAAERKVSELAAKNSALRKELAHSRADFESAKSDVRMLRAEIEALRCEAKTPRIWKWFGFRDGCKIVK